MTWLILARLATAGPLTGGGVLSATTPIAETTTETAADPATTGSDTSDATAAASAVDLGAAAAAIVLGTAVDTVARPSSATDLGLSFGGAFEDGEIPTSYAVELSPFWLGTSAKTLGFEEHVKGGAGSLARNFNVSMAVSNDATDGIGGALAVRTTWWAPPGKGGKTSTSRFARDYAAIFHPTGERTMTLAPGAPVCFQSLAHLSTFLAEVGTAAAQKLQTKAQAKALAAQTAVMEACRSVDPAVQPKTAAVCGEQLFQTAPPRSGPVDIARDTTEVARLQQLVEAKVRAEAAAATDLTSVVKAVVADLKKDPTKLADPLQEYLNAVGFTEAFEGCHALLTRHQGWVMDLAAGASIVSPEATLLGTRGDAVQAWVTPGWVGERESVFVLGRFRLDDLADTPTPGVDVGLGVGYRWSRWALSSQGLVGLPIVDRGLVARVTVGADVLLAKGLWFTTAVGGSLPADEPGSFVTLAGLKLGVTAERTFQTPTYADLASVVP